MKQCQQHGDSGKSIRSTVKRVGRIISQILFIIGGLIILIYNLRRMVVERDHARYINEQRMEKKQQQEPEQQTREGSQRTEASADQQEGTIAPLLRIEKLK